jgi:hypothetical protein
LKPGDRRSHYNLKHYVGEGKEFPTHQKFFDWMYTKPSGATQVQKNGLTWHFCGKCGHWGNHIADNCRAKPSATASIQGHVADHISLTPENSMDDASAISTNPSFKYGKSLGTK